MFCAYPVLEHKAEVNIGGSTYGAEYERKEIDRRIEADAVVEACRGKTGEVKSIDVRKFHQRPPTPFDLGSLQTEAYGLFKYTPRRTGNIAERLYLEALISYPRTSSQKLPPVINYKAILSALSKKTAYKDLASELLEREELKPNEGKRKILRIPRYTRRATCRRGR